MVVKARTAEEIKDYWEATWSKLGLRRIHIRDVPAIIELKAGVDDQRARDDLRVVASALTAYADSPPAPKDAALQKEFWEATWERLGKQVLHFGEIPALIELPVTLKGLRLAETLRSMARELGDYATEIETELKATAPDTAPIIAGAPVEVG